MISRHGSSEPTCTNFPIALAGDPQYSRAKFSEMIAIGRFSNSSSHVMSRPAAIGVPSVEKKFGEMNLKRRTGASSPSRYT